MAQSRDDFVYMARVTEQMERYDEMVEHMVKASEFGEPLALEERNLLSVAFKNSVGSRRAAWRVISSIESREKDKGQPEQAALAESYRNKIEGELHTTCARILELMDKQLIPSASDGETKVFYAKMKGDYYRYKAEFSSGDVKSAAADSAKDAYSDAMTIATADLAVTHPIRLGLALNFSVFHYEVLDNQEEACRMARTAFEDAIAELDNVSEEQYKDSTLIMQLLRDNLTLWTSEQAGEGEQ